jgi:ADP-heptose:LPS heptosyltransferase
MIANKTVYSLNSAAIGDLIAAAPSVKYAIDNFHSKIDYRVAIYPEFLDIFHFVPKDKIINPKDEFPKGFFIRCLNPPKERNGVSRLTPGRLKLTQFASINLLGRVLSDYQSKFIPLLPVEVDRFNVDFSKAILIVTTYRDKQRTILPTEILKIAEYVESKGLIPVYIGRQGAISIWKFFPAISDFEYPGFGIDLRDQTSLTELASIMSKAKAVVGMDSGPVNLAFTTNVPVVCGFTTVSDIYRIPYRGLAKTYPVSPNLNCQFCESNWSLDAWDFNNCPRKMDLAECVTKMTSDKFIAGLEALGVFK